MSKSRQIKFWFLSRVIAPMGVKLVHLLSRSWKLSPAAQAIVAEECKHPNLVCACLHGNLFALLAVSQEAKKHGRTICVMTSPSKDGQLLDVLMEQFGLKVVKGSSRSRAIGAAIEMKEALNSGLIALFAVDGPRGPFGVPKAGAFRIAQMAESRLLCIAASGKKNIPVKAWDFFFIPRFFTTIELHVVPVPAGGDVAEDAGLLAIQQQLIVSHEAVNSPMVPHLAALKQ
jgi:hypothetical protein